MNGSVSIISGTLGGGKTLYAVEQIFYHIVRGGTCFTNIDMNYDEFEKEVARKGYVFDKTRLVRLSSVSLKGFQSEIKRGTKDNPVKVVLDEAHLEWNARDYRQMNSDTQNRSMLDFVTLCRKLDIALDFVTQSEADIDKQLRKKSQVLVICRNFKNFRLWGMIPIPLPLFSRVFFDTSVGNKKPMRFKSDIFGFPIWVGKLYDSDALLGQSAQSFSGLQTAEHSPLKRIERDQNKTWLEHLIVSLIVIFSLV